MEHLKQKKIPQPGCPYNAIIDLSGNILFINHLLSLISVNNISFKLYVEIIVGISDVAIIV